MKYRAIVSYALICCHSLLVATNQAYPDWVYVDFDLSMQTFSFPNAIALTENIVGIDGNNTFAFF